MREKYCDCNFLYTIVMIIVSGLYDIYNILYDIYNIIWPLIMNGRDSFLMQLLYCCHFAFRFSGSIFRFACLQLWQRIAWQFVRRRHRFACKPLAPSDTRTRVSKFFWSNAKLEAEVRSYYSEAFICTASREYIWRFIRSTTWDVHFCSILRCMDMCVYVYVMQS